MPRKNSSMSNQYRDVIVIGAGASGLMAAIAAASEGASVLVLNHHSVPGKKILSTGNGRCNFTNSFQDPSCYRSDDPALLDDAFGQFSSADTIAFFEKIGVYAKERDGYYYPLSSQASTIREALLEEAEHKGVEIQNDIDISDVTVENGVFHIAMRTDEFDTRKCILATGGKAAPKTGSDGSGYLYAMGLGHSVQNPLPALVPLTSKEKWLRRTAGVRCDGSVALYVDGEEVSSDRGELQFTESSVSGIPVFQVSRFASIALADHRQVEARIDFFPDSAQEELAAFLMDLADRLGSYKSWYHILCGLCNQKLAAMFCDSLNLAFAPAHQYSRETGQEQAAQLAALLKETILPISGTGSMEHAQTTCGGVPLREIGPDMQSKLVPGLFFAGEILNVDGICGGYNLQWAWTSGYLAGHHAAGQSKGSGSADSVL